MKNKHKIAYMETAFVWSKCSIANKLKVGCVLVKNNRVISNGYNGMPSNINDDCELPDGSTDPRVRHAEKNCLNAMMKFNESSVGSLMFCTHSCCEPCAIDIVEAGVKEFYYKETYRCSSGIKYLLKNKVNVFKYLEEESRFKCIYFEEDA